IDVSSPEYAHAQLRDRLSALEPQQRNAPQPIDPDKKNSAVRVTYEYPFLPADLSSEGEGVRRSLQRLEAHAWFAHASDSQKAVAIDAVRWGKQPVADAVQLAEQFISEWRDAHELVQQSMVAIRRLIDYRNGLHRESAVGILMKLYLGELSRKLKASAAGE